MASNSPSMASIQFFAHAMPMRKMLLILRKAIGDMKFLKSGVCSAQLAVIGSQFLEKPLFPKVACGEMDSMC
jgi:hypothetical protein